MQSSLMSGWAQAGNQAVSSFLCWRHLAVHQEIGSRIPVFLTAFYRVGSVIGLSGVGVSFLLRPVMLIVFSEVG